MDDTSLLKRSVSLLHYPSDCILLTLDDQPTGGVVVVIDNKPSAPKTLIELKAKKVVRTAPATDTIDDRLAQAFARTGATAATSGAGGAAAAAAVLNSIDEDDEDGEDAPLPKTFEYETEAESDEE